MEFPSALSVVDPRGVGSAPIDPAQRYAVYQRTVLQVLGATVAALSVVFSLFTLYWFMKVKSSFRHRLVMLLINGDMVKAFSFLLFPVVYLSGAPIERSSGFCQAIGFFTQLGTEAADIAVLIIALHTALYIFRPPGSLREGGVYPYRKFVYSAWVIFPLTMASLAFVNPDDGYASQGAFCSLPIRPFWYRLALAWIPRYIILGVIIGIYVAIYVFVQCKFHGIESTLSTGSMEERLSLPRAKVPQPTKERSTSTHVACTIERFQFLGIPDLAVNGLAPSRLTSSVEVNPWDEDIASTNYDPFITRAESAGISGDGTSNDLPKTDGHKEVWQTLGPRYPRMSSGSSFLPFDRLRTSGYLKTPGFFRAKYMPKTPSSGPEVVRQKAQDPLTDIDITDFDKEVWEMSNSSLPGERQETPSVLAKVDTADIPLPDVTDFDKGVCEIPDSSLLVECQETPSAWTKADTADMPLPELTEFDKGVGEMPESSLPGKVQDKSVFAKVDTADMPLPDTTDFDKKVLEISDSTLQGKLLDESVSAKVDTADMPLQDTTDFDKKVLEMSDSSLPGKLQDKSALPKVDTADMPFSHITDSDKQVLEMSDSTVPGKVQDKTVLPKVDT
ncbi:MAG: hypothetical protein M1833_006976, partial [Piccolia ochrophora]